MAETRGPDGEADEVQRDEGGASDEGERDDETVQADEAAGEAESTENVARAKRWTDERAEHWHGATSSQATQDRADSE
ncbi:hypothetical protein [Agromyces sp. M3QZ16-3]|uniref:hypothetical protein n=1 Tax=Agromyces sp. M3QZ16-3 TaxID=3447585 RepID=UPI003F6905D0